MKGWYTRVITKSNPEIRWVTVDNFWISFYGNKSDLTPLLLIHTSNLSFDTVPEDFGLAHSFRLIIDHVCAQKNLIISTPNQFDIEEIREAILTEQKNWYQKQDTTQPELPKKYTTDMTGKFIFRNADRIFVTVTETGLKIEQEGKPTNEVVFNETFDVYPTLETESDSKWVSVTSNSGSYHLHFANVSDLESFVSTALHTYNVSKGAP